MLRIGVWEACHFAGYGLVLSVDLLAGCGMRSLFVVELGEVEEAQL